MTTNDFLPTECDVIMEGGVTSGVVFPSFIAGLAGRFNLRNIGGTSVGAVAAVAAAAAQFKRNHERSQLEVNQPAVESGYKRLADIPLWLQSTNALGQSNLFSLFQPCPDLAPHFKTLQAALNQTSLLMRVLCIIAALYSNFTVGAFIGFTLVIAMFIGPIVCHHASLPNGCIAWLLALVWLIAKALFAALALALLECVLRALRGLRRNRFGICSGYSPTATSNSASVPALTQWLHTLVQEISNLPDHDPLTFGLLKDSQPSIELAFITTGISELRSHRLPSDSENVMFRKSDLEQLFPPAIITWMVEHSKPIELMEDDTLAWLKIADSGLDTAARDLYFLPKAKDLPVVFAARLSLSFPVLLQAIPLYRLRYVEGDGIAKGSMGIKKIWFSDGGLTSNFPIHFFDSLLPSRPTFGITLDNSLAAGAKPEDRVFLPTNNRQGLVGKYLALESPDGTPSLSGFASALLATIRGWHDEALKHTPGFRDRIVQIRHTKNEGGLNLDMPIEAIQAMSQSGTLAAQTVINRYLNTNSVENGWLNHRWVRVRSAAALLQDKVKPLDSAWAGGSNTPSYEAMWLGTVKDMPTSYQLNAQQRAVGAAMWKSLVAAGTASANVNLSEDSPKPQPTLEIAPKQS